MGKLTAMGLMLVLVTTAVVGAFELPRRFAAADEALVVQLAVAPPARARPEPIGLAVEKEEKRAKGRLYLSAALTVGAGLVAYWGKETAAAASDRATIWSSDASALARCSAARAPPQAASFALHAAWCTWR